ncbi:MAG: hypothetical protein COA58_03010 [Bacteroidetes bacterium]|nr:MAG: hypothetical protein COA58_03010 [Bacteroidota bacterium]
MKNPLILILVLFLCITTSCSDDDTSLPTIIIPPSFMDIALGSYEGEWIYFDLDSIENEERDSITFEVSRDYDSSVNDILVVNLAKSTIKTANLSSFFSDVTFDIVDFTDRTNPDSVLVIKGHQISSTSPDKQHGTYINDQLGFSFHGKVFYNGILVGYRKLEGTKL